MTEHGRPLLPYVSRLAATWADRFGDASHAELDGTLIKVDLSGFTRLSERLARRVRGGAEELSRVISEMFEGLIALSAAEGGDVLMFGGDAVLLWFEGDAHEVRAVRAVRAMHRHVREHGRHETPAGPVRLRMSAGGASGAFCFALIGRSHRELVVAGERTSTALRLEGSARPGELLVDGTTAAALDGIASASGHAYRVHRTPPADPAATRADDVAVAPVPRPERIRHLVPPDIAAVVEAGPPPGEHRRIVVAFITTAGNDDVLREGGAPALVDALDRVAAAVDEAVDRFGVCWSACDAAVDGTVFLLYAGAPLATEDDEERMLRAVRLVTDRCASAGLRIGVNSGPAFAGDVGHHDRRTFAILGDTVNLAARLMARARPGTVLATDAVIDRSRARFSTEPLPPFTVKGKRLPVTAVEVGELVEVGASQRHVAQALPIIGRDAELAVLRAALDRLAAGRGGAVELVGEPGIGKSRLLTEVVDLGRQRGATVAVGSGEPYEASTPYYAVGSALRILLGIDPAAPADEVPVRLGTVLSGETDLGADRVPLIAPALRAAAADATAGLDPAVVQARRHDAVADVVAAIATHRPLVLAIEDLHWADQASHALVRRLIDATGRTPLLVIATRRRMGEPLAGAETVDVEPLDGDAAVRLVRAAIGDRPMFDTAVAALAERAAGNPLFATELAATADRAGQLADLPSRLDRLVSARIDTLAPADRTLLREASVLGAVAPVDDLVAVLGDPSLRDAARWVRLTPFVDAGRDAIRFRHDVVRQAAYDGLSQRRRRHLHESVATELLRRADDDTDALAPLLARHFTEAGLATNAWRWSARAADMARRTGDLADAVQLLRGALGQAGRAPEVGDAAVLAAAEELGDVLELLGRYAEADDAFRRARSHTVEAVDRARLMLKRAELAEKEGEFRTALARQTRTLSLVDRVATVEAARLRAGALLGRGFVRFYQGRFGEAAHAVREALVIARAIDDDHVRARAHLQLEMVASETGAPDRAEHGERALELFERLGDGIGLGNLHLNLGVSAYNEGRWDDALAHYEASAAAYRTVGDVARAASPVNNQAEILTDQGRYAEAAAKLDEARGVWRAAGYALGVAFTTSGRSRLAVRSGRFADAHELLDEAMHDFEALGASAMVNDTAVRRVECLVADGRFREALELARPLADELEDMAILPLTLDRLMAIALAGLGRIVESMALLSDVLGRARSERVAYEVACCLDLQRRFGRADRGAAVELAALCSDLGIVRLDQPVGELGTAPTT